jgi:hypothetical protein
MQASTVTFSIPSVTQRILAVIIVPLVFVGCGSTSRSTPESTQVSSLVHRYYTALARDNGSEVCSLMTGDTKRQVTEETEHYFAEKGPPGSNLSCQEAVERTREHTGSAEVAEIEHDKLGVTSLAGGRATVVARQNSHVSVMFTLSKTSGGWLISKVPVSAG